MENGFSNIGYVPLRNSIDFSVGSSPVPAIPNSLVPLESINEMKPKDQSIFSPFLRSTAFLLDPFKLFSHLPELPNISIFSNIFPKNNAPSYDSIRNGNGAVVLSIGQVGPSVKTLQQTLTKLGFNVRETGNFDIYTQTALKNFQASRNIEQTGKLGKTTLEALDKVQPNQLNRGLASSSKFMNPSNIAQFHYNQYSGLASQNGDCGPSAVKMVLKANGMDASIGTIRQAAGVPRPRSGAWAISEDEIGKSISRLSNGRIKEADRKSFNVFNESKMINYLKSELDKGRMPVLLTANNSLTGRHYTVVVGVKDDGSVLVADSVRNLGDSGGISTYSHTNMLKRLAAGSLYGGTCVMSFEKK